MQDANLQYGSSVGLKINSSDNVSQSVASRVKCNNRPRLLPARYL